ncbi:MAG: hypothetical protein JST89_01965 [Cyanobacteria bacterium SZAS-4]|nr:hypothetical protein [Cyanobacteria bacterium SZAS-4]
MKNISYFPKGDPDLIKFLENFGGWQRVLDPSFNPPEEIYQGFEAAGYTRERLDKMRALEGRTERDAWIATLAHISYAYWWASYLQYGPKPHRSLHFPGYPGRTPGVRWYDHPSDCWKNYEEKMKKLSIAKEDIDNWIECHPEEFLPIGSNET